MNAVEISPSVAPASANVSSVQPSTRSRLWIWFVLLFAVQLGVWTAWFVIAAHNKVQEVPVTAAGVKL